MMETINILRLNNCSRTISFNWKLLFILFHFFPPSLALAIISIHLIGKCIIERLTFISSHWLKVHWHSVGSIGWCQSIDDDENGTKTKSSEFNIVRMFVRQQLNIGYTLCANGNWSAKIPWKNEIVNQTRRRSTAFVWNWIWWKHMSASVIMSCNMHTSQRFSREKWKKKWKNQKIWKKRKSWCVTEGYPFLVVAGKSFEKHFFFIFSSPWRLPSSHAMITLCIQTDVEWNIFTQKKKIQIFQIIIQINFHALLGIRCATHEQQDLVVEIVGSCKSLSSFMVTSIPPSLVCCVSSSSAHYNMVHMLIFLLSVTRIGFPWRAQQHVMRDIVTSSNSWIRPADSDVRYTQTHNFPFSSVFWICDCSWKLTHTHTPTK